MKESWLESEVFGFVMMVSFIVSVCISAVSICCLFCSSY